MNKVCSCSYRNRNITSEMSKESTVKARAISSEGVSNDTADAPPEDLAFAVSVLP